MDGSNRRLRRVWWIQIAVAFLAIPWAYFRTKQVVAATLDPETLGEGAGFGIFLGIFVPTVVVLAVIFVATFAIPIIAGLFAPRSEKGPAVAAMAVSVLWTVPFAFIAIFDGVLPLLFALNLIGLAITSAIDLTRLRSVGNVNVSPPPQGSHPVS